VESITLTKETGDKMSYINHDEAKGIVILMALVAIFMALYTVAILMWGINIGAKTNAGFVLGEAYGRMTETPVNNQSLYGTKKK